MSESNVDQATNETEGVKIGETLFKLRDYTPIPLIVLLIWLARPTAASATLGVLIVILGELIRIYAVSFIGTVSRTRSHSTGSELITDGAFAIVRNPLYLGNFFIVFGLSIWASSFLLILINTVAFALQYYFILQFEDSILLRRFGPEYSDYKRSVPAFIPTQLPSWEEWEWPMSFSPALKSEKRTLTAILVILTILIIRTF